MKKIVLIGDPIGHSMSPVIHNAGYKELGIEHDFHYDKALVKANELGSFIELVRSREIYAAQVTIPHKIAIIPYLDKLTMEAELIGAVNTIYFDDKKLVGHNTDGIGCLKTLKENDVDVKGKTILLLGAGGASRAIAFTLGLNGVKKFIILDLLQESAKKLADDVASKINISSISASSNDVKRYLSEVDILIHCTPIGMKGEHENKTLLYAADFAGNKSIVVMDIVYNPQKTLLLAEAEKAGCKIVKGLGMLLHQGVTAFEIFTGQKAPVEVMRKALELGLKTNIALIGFMATGKSDAGKRVAKALSMNFVETDEMIVKKVGKPIPEIFEKEGEAAFRQMEKEAVKEASSMEKVVISCGGGVVIDKENVDALKKNCKIVLLTAKPETILLRTKDDKSRPLLNKNTYKEKLEAIKTLLAKREQAYKDAADLIIETDPLPIGKLAERIIEVCNL